MKGGIENVIDSVSLNLYTILNQMEVRDEEERLIIASSYDTKFDVLFGIL